MSKNKEKKERLELRLSAGDKEKIARLAEKCDLPISQYVLQRALGYEPRSVPTGAFYDLYRKLCDICNSGCITPETEEKLLCLLDAIHAEFMLPKKATQKDIVREVSSWQQQASGRSKVT